MLESIFNKVEGVKAWKFCDIVQSANSRYFMITRVHCPAHTQIICYLGSLVK